MIIASLIYWAIKGYAFKTKWWSDVALKADALLRFDYYKKVGSKMKSFNNNKLHKLMQLSQYLTLVANLQAHKIHFIKNRETYSKRLHKNGERNNTSMT